MHEVGPAADDQASHDVAGPGPGWNQTARGQEAGLAEPARTASSQAARPKQASSRLHTRDSSPNLSAGSFPYKRQTGHYLVTLPFVRFYKAELVVQVLCGIGR